MGTNAVNAYIYEHNQHFQYKLKHREYIIKATVKQRTHDAQDYEH